MEFGGLIPYIVSKKADLGIANIAITEERKKSVLFTAPLFDEQHGILALKTSGKVADKHDGKLSYTDFVGKKIGVGIGSVADRVIEGPLKAIPAYYSGATESIEDVRRGRIDGFIWDLSAARIFTASARDVECLEIPAEIFLAPQGAFSNNQDIINSFNAFLAKLKSDGILADMKNRWLKNVPDLKTPMPDIPLTGKNGTLKIATCGTEIPFSYVGNNKEYKGYSIELAMRFAAYRDMNIEFADMDFGGMIPYVSGGKADLGIANVSITEERKKSVLFTDSVYDDQLGIITLKKSAAGIGKIPEYSDFIGKKFAVKNGSIYDFIVTDLMKASEKLLFEDYPSVYEAVQKGKVDAAMRNYYAAHMSILDSAYADLDVITLPEHEHDLLIAAISMDQSIIDIFNKFLTVIKADGTYDAMKTRWFDTFDPSNIPSMPEIPLTSENGRLIVAISSDYMPYSFLGDSGVHLGFDIEMAKRFAAYVKKDIEFVDMAFSGLLPYVMSGKADIAISDITITAERKKSVLFTEPYIADKSAIIFKRASSASAKEIVSTRVGFIGWLKTGIDRNLITDNRWKMIANGLGVTMVIALAAQLLGTIFGCFVCYLLTRKSRIVRWIGNLYCGLIYGTPVVVLLMITYYIIFGNTDISNILVAIVAFTMVMGAVIAQNLKGAIGTVDPVEIEAARSIGFSAFKAFLTVTFPQAVRHALPGYTNGFVELVKATAIVGFIAIQDLTRAADIIRSRTYDAYFPLLLVAIIYLLVTAICVWLFKLIVNKVNRGVSQ